MNNLSPAVQFQITNDDYHKYLQQFYLIYRWDPNRYPLQDRVDLRVISIKGHSALLKVPELEPHH